MTRRLALVPRPALSSDDNEDRPATDGGPEPFVNCKVASPFLAMPEGTVRSMVSRGQLPHYRLAPRVVRFRLSELEAWAAARRRGA